MRLKQFSKLFKYNLDADSYKNIYISLPPKFDRFKWVICRDWYDYIVDGNWVSELSNEAASRHLAHNQAESEAIYLERQLMHANQSKARVRL